MHSVQINNDWLNLIIINYTFDILSISLAFKHKAPTGKWNETQTDEVRTAFPLFLKHDYAHIKYINNKCNDIMFSNKNSQMWVFEMGRRKIVIWKWQREKNKNLSICFGFLQSCLGRAFGIHFKSSSKSWTDGFNFNFFLMLYDKKWWADKIRLNITIKNHLWGLK